LSALIDVSGVEKNGLLGKQTIAKLNLATTLFHIPFHIQTLGLSTI